MISSLSLKNFRSFSTEAFKFEPRVNIIVGKNGAGKTNILEAILISRTGSSYRAKDVDLIMFNKPWARLETVDEGNKRIVKLVKDSLPSKTVEVNSKTYQRLPQNQKLPVVLFEPNHLSLLSGPPEARRSYLDSLIEQISPDYGRLIRTYTRALAQRNALLKNQPNNAEKQLFPWNVRISQLGGKIVGYRQALIGRINKELPPIYEALSGSTIKTAVIYKPKLPLTDYESHFLNKLEINLHEDLRLGFTLYGPQREDFMFTFNKHSASNYASRGELRTAVLALKITERELTRKVTGQDPLLLLDDVYSELDLARRKALTAYIKGHQVFITTTDADLIIKQLGKDCRVIKLG